MAERSKGKLAKWWESRHAGPCIVRSFVLHLSEKRCLWELLSREVT